MDNPWATAWENPDHLSEKQSKPSAWSSGAEQEADIGLPSWSAASTSQWTATSVPAGTIWPAVHGDANAWVPSPADDHSLRHREETSEQDITARDERDASQPPAFSSADIVTPTVSDHQSTPSSSPIPNLDLVAETSDDASDSSQSVSRVHEQEENPDAWADATALAPADNDWGVSWAATPSAESNQQETRPPDEWETARQEKEKLNRAVPPQLLESMIRHCQQVSEEIWPPLGTASGDNWRTGLDDLQDMLLAQLLPDDTLPPPVQFSETATAKAMNEALKLTRHLPLSARSPLSRLLVSRGSLDWERSIKSKQDTVLDAAPVGWRVLEKEDRLNSTEDSKPKTAAGSLLSFWNRRVSTVVTAPTESPMERSMSPARSSLDSVKPDSPQNTSRIASPSRPTISSVPILPSTDAKTAGTATTSTPSAVSRFFNRFSRTKSAQHTSLALSSNDLEFLSDIVPSASDLDEEHSYDSGLEVFSILTKSSSLPPKLPPPLPPPKPSTLLNRPSSVGIGILDGGNVLLPPLSPRPSSSLARAQSPNLPLKGMVVPANTSKPVTTSMPQNLSFGPQPNSRPHSPFTLPPPPKVPASLSIPSLLPPPVSPPQTPRPSVVPSAAMSSASSTTWLTNSPAFYDSRDADDEFSAFSSCSSAPFPSIGTYPQRSPSPPSPPPRRTYERTHYPSTSSTSSVQSPSSQNSETRLQSARSSISASLDDFDDFVAPSITRGGSRKPTSPPSPIPTKPQAQAQAQPQQLNRIDTYPSRVYHTHSSNHTFASPTLHTRLMSSSAFSPTAVSDIEHQRTQHLVDRAAAHGGLLWPNSPESPPESRVRAVPPPPSSSMSPKSSIGEDSVDLLGDGDFFGSTTLPVLLAPLGSSLGGSLGGIPKRSPMTSPVMNATSALPGTEMGIGVKTPLPPSSPPSSSSLFSFSSLGAPAAAPVAKAGSLQSPKPTQTGGLSAQDLSFFEGL